jgi:hypothetical protein
MYFMNIELDSVTWIQRFMYTVADVKFFLCSEDMRKWMYSSTTALDGGK